MTPSQTPMPASTAASHVCPVCQRVVWHPVITFAGQSFRLPARCQCEIDLRDAEERAIRLAERKARIDRLFAASDLGAYQGADWYGWERRQGTEAAAEAVREFLAHPDRRGILLTGAPGSGKTMLGAIAVNEFIRQGRPAILADVPALMIRFEATYRRGAGETEDELLSALITADLLVLDDIGAQKWTEKREERLHLIIDGRYRAAEPKPIIATTNITSLGALEAVLSARTFSRLMAMCEPVEVTATDYRIETALRRAGQRAEDSPPQGMPKSGPERGVGARLGRGSV